MSTALGLSLLVNVCLALAILLPRLPRRQKRYYRAFVPSVPSGYRRPKPAPVPERTRW